jgi:biotin-independent malonate decarboxylase beta subunit
MSTSYVSLAHPPRIRAFPPIERIGALADGGHVVSLDTPRPSLHLARFGIVAQQDDGIATARIEIAGATVLVAAQDESFLRGSVGANHGDALRELFAKAERERPAAVVLVAASGGVRLHEANAAELSLGRALRALLDARAAGVVVLALVVGDVFGGSSVLACAADRTAILTGARLGLSGPKVIESIHGKWELDADRADDVESVFGSRARSAAIDHIVDDADAIRGWIRMAVANAVPFADHVTNAQRLLAVAPPVNLPAFPLRAVFPDAQPYDPAGWLWRAGEIVATRPAAGAAFGVAFAHGLDAALLAMLLGERDDARRETIVIVEDSAGHEASRAAEMRFISRYLAHHAAVLALARSRGHRVVGLLAGVGHSAAFFVNALQAAELYALPRSRVVAMEPNAIARVTGLDTARLIEDDPLLGQPVRHFETLGGIAAIVDAEEFRRRVAR